MLPDDRDRLIHEKLLLSAITMNSLDVHIVAAFQTAKPALEAEDSNGGGGGSSYGTITPRLLIGLSSTVAGLAADCLVIFILSFRFVHSCVLYSCSFSASDVCSLCTALLLIHTVITRNSYLQSGRLIR